MNDFRQLASECRERIQFYLHDNTGGEDDVKKALILLGELASV